MKMFANRWSPANKIKGYLFNCFLQLPFYHLKWIYHSRITCWNWTEFCVGFCLGWSSVYWTVGHRDFYSQRSQTTHKICKARARINFNLKPLFKLTSNAIESFGNLNELMHFSMPHSSAERTKGWICRYNQEKDHSPIQISVKFDDGPQIIAMIRIWVLNIEHL